MDTPFELDVLIGSDYYLDIVQGERIHVVDGLYLLSSRVGWILTGRMVLTKSKQPTSATVGLTVSIHETSLLAPESNIQDIWSLERIGITDDPNKIEDDEAMRHFKQNVKLDNGRYEVCWPWKQNADELPTNYGLAAGRLRSLLVRLEKRPDLKQKCTDMINQQEATGIVEKVNLTGTPNRVHYLPFHPIETPLKTTTKVRLVYDASARTTKNSLFLNDCLHRGPLLLENLVGLVLRFRAYPIALVADIEKAFHQIALQEKDRDVTRFIWVKDVTQPPTQDNLQVYRFCRVAFGMKSSPFLLEATVAHHLEQCGGRIADQIRQDMYVDNLVTGAYSLEDALQLFMQGKEMFQKIGMNLREWASNHPELQTKFPNTDKGTNDICKVLGMTWNTTTDQMSHHPMILDDEKSPTTKREALSMIARAFDPLGMVSPVIIRSRLLLQRLSKHYKDWDQPLSPTDRHQCGEIRQEPLNIHKAMIPRHIGLQKADQLITLICFCDASSLACCTTVYARICQDSRIHTSLVFAKTRVAPMKTISIPRMELDAMVLGVRASHFVRQHIRVPTPVIIFSDSQCVLQWIKSCKQQSSFVENRLKEIRKAEVEQFRYVESSENPSDIGTRGCKLAQLNKFWWEGPTWLQLPQKDWPEWKQPESKEIDAERIDQPENLVAGVTTATQKIENTLPPFGIQCERFSSLSRLLRVTAWCNRWIMKIRRQGSSLTNGPTLSVSELQTARFLWERHVQAAHFGDLNKSLETGTSHSLKRQLGVSKDKADSSKSLMRCYGRLANAELPEDAKYPILLPRNHPWTILVIRYTHEKGFHSGVAHSLAQLRLRYWVPKGRLQVKRVIDKCLVCKRHGGGPFPLPTMPELPVSRVSVVQPYTFTGLDYFGPLLVKESSNQRKVWVVLFTCLTIRAVHLEMVLDMSTQQFLLALRRFFARCGTPSTILCDNAPQLKTAQQATEGYSRKLPFHDETVKQWMANSGVKWNYIPAFTPWQGRKNGPACEAITAESNWKSQTNKGATGSILGGSCYGCELKTACLCR